MRPQSIPLTWLLNPAVVLVQPCVIHREHLVMVGYDCPVLKRPLFDNSLLKELMVLTATFSVNAAYVIVCAGTGEIYLDGTPCLCQEVVEHRQALVTGSHHNLILQQLFNLYGSSAFHLSAVVFDCAQDVINNEQHLKHLFTQSVGGSSLVIPSTHYAGYDVL